MNSCAGRDSLLFPLKNFPGPPSQAAVIYFCPWGGEEEFLGSCTVALIEHPECWRPPRCPRIPSDVKGEPRGEPSPLPCEVSFPRLDSRAEISSRGDTKSRVWLPARHQGQLLPLKEASPQLLCLAPEPCPTGPKLLHLKKNKKSQKKELCSSSPVSLFPPAISWS